jgi:hypothetical protein
VTEKSGDFIESLTNSEKDKSRQKEAICVFQKPHRQLENYKQKTRNKLCYNSKLTLYIMNFAYFNILLASFIQLIVGKELSEAIK